MQIPEYVSGRKITPRGVHLHPNGLHNYWMQNSAYWLDLLVDMGMSWCLALSESDNFYLSGAAGALLEAGVIPIVRFNYKFPKPWTHMEATEQLVALYAQYDAPLVVQFANEPFDGREWVDGEIPPYNEAWQIIVDRWHQAAALIIERGAYAGFPDGPVYSENPFLRIGDESHWWEDGKAVYLCHNYGKGRPVDYPSDDVSMNGTPLTLDEYCQQLDDYCTDPQWNWIDTPLELMNAQRWEWKDPNLNPVLDPVCWRGWEQVAQYSLEAFGYVVQMGLTEGGWVPRDRAGSNPVDIRWPYTTPNVVAQKTLTAYNDETPHFAICPWLLADGDMAGGDVGWPFDAWIGWCYEDKYGREKPVVQMLKDNPPGQCDPAGAYEKVDQALANLGGALIDLSYCS